MSAATTTGQQPTIETGLVYTVTWADNTDPEMIRLFTPKSGRRAVPEAHDPEHPPSWLMIGARLTRFIAWVRSYGGDPDRLEFAPWTDTASIAECFARVFGFPGRMGFDASGMTGLRIHGGEFGGNVTIVEADTMAGAEVVVQPLKIGDGWVGLVAMVGPAPRVLAIKAEIVAVITANMLGSSCRRTRSEALAFLASCAMSAFPALASLLSRRKASAGLSEPEARAARLGELLGVDVASPCWSLFQFAEHNGSAAISMGADHDAVSPGSCGTGASEFERTDEASFG